MPDGHSADQARFASADTRLSYGIPLTLLVISGTVQVTRYCLLRVVHHGHPLPEYRWLTTARAVRALPLLKTQPAVIGV